MNFILFDDELRKNFLPLSYSRPVAELLTGLFSNRRRWECYLEGNTSTITADYLQRKFPVIIEDDNLLINSRILPSKELTEELHNLKSGQQLMSDDAVIGIRVKGAELERALEEAGTSAKLSRLQFFRKMDLMSVKSAYHIHVIQHVWQLFSNVAGIFEEDIKILDSAGFNRKVTDTNTLIGKNIHIHKNAVVRAAILNTEYGPIVIDDGAEVMEGSLIRGPVYIGKHSTIKMGAKIYGPVSIGESVKAGGEISSSIIHGYSNKGHDGFIGHTVIGEWCNLGADTNTSNLKNDYGSVALWNEETQEFADSGQQFLGLVMGDHSKCGINTMFNTGTTVGMSCNIYGGGFQPKFIPSFTWGGVDEFSTFRYDKAVEVARRMMERRKKNIDGNDELIFKEVMQQTKSQREHYG